MFTRLRSTVLAGSGGLILVLSLSGIVAAATILTAIAAPVADPIQPAALVDTTATFEDLDGNGVDDDCQTDVVANPDAAAAAEKAADLDGDGKISVSEAAQSGRTGGKNCNHGGYVSAVAHSGDACDDAEPAETTDAADEVGTLPDGETVVAVVTETTTETTTADTTCTEETTDATEAVETTTETSETTDTTVCETTVTTTTETTTDVADAAPNAHGKLVSEVAQSDAVGGKNCNHGGAVSEAAHKDQAAKDAAREAAKAARQAAQAARHQNQKHGKANNG